MRCKSKSGFSLLEMLVVVGILGTLIAALVGSYTYVQKMAWQVQAQELVTNAATALTLLLQKEGGWPSEILDSRGEFNQGVCRIIQEHHLMDITAYQVDGSGNVKYDGDGKPVENKNSPDRYGLLDPWGRRALWRNPSLTLGSDMPGKPGVTLRDHLIQFRVDIDFDGKVSDGELGNVPMGKAIPGSVIVWSVGPSGNKEEWTTGRYPKEHRLSWSFGLER